MTRAPLPARATPRLAVFMPSLAGGGAEGVMTDLMNGFCDRGVGVELLMPEVAGVNLMRLSPRVQITDMQAGSVLRAVPKLHRLLRAGRHGALLSMMSHANIAACAAAAQISRAKLRVVLSERMSFEAREWFYTSVAERIVRAAMPLAFRRADAIIVPSRDMAPNLIRHTRLPPRVFHAIPNPLPLEDIARRCAAAWPLGDELASQGKRIVLAAGRLSGVKDFPTLLGAFALLDASKNAHLVILGEGEERASLERMVADLALAGRVSMPGHLPDPLPAMARAHAFVLSSRFEGMPNVLLQALAAKAPVISTDCPTGPRQILENGKHGALVPVGDVGKMAAAIDAALSHPSLPPNIDLSHYMPDTIIDKYLAVLFPYES